jgi:hypothetical protein
MLAEASAAAQTARLPPQRWGWCNAPSSLAFAMFGLIDILRYRDPARARALALVIADEVKIIGEVHFAAFAQRALGMLAADIGQEDSARRNLVQSLELAEQSGSVRNIARSQQELARLSLSAGDASAAHDSPAQRPTPAATPDTCSTGPDPRRCSPTAMYGSASPPVPQRFSTRPNARSAAVTPTCAPGCSRHDVRS